MPVTRAGCMFLSNGVLCALVSYGLLSMVDGWLQVIENEYCSKHRRIRTTAENQENKGASLKLWTEIFLWSESLQWVRWFCSRLNNTRDPRSFGMTRVVLS